MTEQMGSVVQGKVIRIRAYGAFVELPSGETGLVHISEIAEEFVRSVGDYLSEGEEVTVKVLSRNDDDKLNLSIKQVMQQDVDSIRYDQEIAEVQRDLSERETHMPQNIDVPKIEKPVERPFIHWMADAQSTLQRLERKKAKAQSQSQSKRNNNRHRGRRNNNRRRRPRSSSSST